MPNLTKIATCSFCGSRSLLKLRELDRHHELSCASCAAPLHIMKPLKVARSDTAERSRRVKYVPMVQQRQQKKKYKKPSKIKRMFDDIIEELWDEIEDIFD